MFDRAKEGVRDWAPQRAAGFDLVPAVPPLEAGQDLLLAFRQGPFFVTGAARVVYVVDEPDRFGFAYGTLPGHPETGEEAFIVERNGDGDVRFTITAFSRPPGAPGKTWWTRDHGRPGPGDPALPAGYVPGDATGLRRPATPAGRCASFSTAATLAQPRRSGSMRNPTRSGRW